MGEVQKFFRDHEYSEANKLHKLKYTDTFLETYNLPGLSHEEASMERMAAILLLVLALMLPAFAQAQPSSWRLWDPGLHLCVSQCFEPLKILSSLLLELSSDGQLS